MTDTQRSVFDLTPPEKLQLVEDLWDDLASNSEDVEVPDWQKEELLRRIEKWEKDPPVCSNWDVVKERILKRDR
jgi:putative addiction module component (TIGR02574 family)